MKQIKVNPNNEQFYSKEFIRGFNLGAERQYEADIADMPKWIPCSERLPGENEVVLTQARFADDIKMAVSARIDYNYWTGWGTREVNVVAWMPLPTPYKEEDE